MKDTFNFDNPLIGKADIHIHSNYSDGRPNIEQILDYVVEKTDLDVIAITDHDTIEGALKAQRLAKKKKLKINVIVGEEVSSKEGHIIGLFLKKKIQPGLRAHEVLMEIRKQGGIALFPHPFYQTTFFDGNKNSLGGVGIITLIREKEDFDAIEVINGTPVMMAKENNMARFINSTLLFKSETGGSDSHILKAIGKAYTIFEGKTAKDLKLALLTGQTKAVSDRWDIKSVIRYAFFFLPQGFRIGLFALLHWRESRRLNLSIVKLKRVK